MEKLKTLEEHNASLIDFVICSNEPVKNGIACPKCGDELYDTCPNITLTSHPAQKNIGCLKNGCGYNGYRVA